MQCIHYKTSSTSKMVTRDVHAAAAAPFNGESTWRMTSLMTQFMTSLILHTKEFALDYPASRVRERERVLDSMISGVMKALDAL